MTMTSALRRHFASAAVQPPSARVSVLSNGLTVASSPAPAHFVSVGVTANVGSMLESARFSGCSQLLDRLAFKATASMPTEVLLNAIDSIGGTVQSHSSREAVMYQAAVFPQHLREAVGILGSVVKEPLFLPEELETMKKQLSYEADLLQWNYGAYLPEKLHQIAYGSKLGNSLNRYSIQKVDHVHRIASLCAAESGLGNQGFCDDVEQLSRITSKTLKEFHQLWFTPDRLVVAGVGMPHEVLEELAEREFGSMPAASAEIKTAQDEQLKNKSKYTGGICIVDTTGKPVSPNPDDRLLTHVYIAFEAPGVLDPDVYALATLASLLGGGGSFSAGGPGKGMYTRLYTEVLNRYHWVENCNTLSYSYQPSSLFGISASVPPSPETHSHIIPILLSHMHMSTSPKSLDKTALSRAKNQLKSNLLMSLESRSVELEDLARQVLAQGGKRVDVAEMCRRVDAVSAEDIARVARRVFMGENTRSPLEFDADSGGVLEHWTRTGDGGPTILVHGPMTGDRDAMYAVDERVREWGLGGDAFLRTQASGVQMNGGRGGGGFGRAIGRGLFGGRL